jgi:hypothetical protein
VHLPRTFRRRNRQDITVLIFGSGCATHKTADSEPDPHNVRDVASGYRRPHLRLSGAGLPGGAQRGLPQIPGGRVRPPRHLLDARPGAARRRRRGAALRRRSLAGRAAPRRRAPVRGRPHIPPTRPHRRSLLDGGPRGDRGGPRPSRDGSLRAGRSRGAGHSTPGLSQTRTVQSRHRCAFAGRTRN